MQFKIITKYLWLIDSVQFDYYHFDRFPFIFNVFPNRLKYFLGIDIKKYFLNEQNIFNAACICLG